MECYKRVIGELRNGEKICSSDHVKNPFEAVFGVSGSGKTTFLNQQIHQLVLGKIPVLVFNYNHCMSREQMPPGFKAWYEENVQVYHAGSGIPLNIMDQSLYGKVPKGKQEDIMIDQLTDILGSAYSLPITQLAELRSAIKGVYETDAYLDAGISSIGDFLREAECQAAKSVFMKMRPLLELNALVAGEISLEKPIIEFDLNGVDMKSPFIIAKILIAHFYLRAKAGQFAKTKLAMVIDEAQHFDFSTGVFYELMTEARKADMILLFATAESPFKKSLVNLQQCSTKLYFQPSKDARKVAKLISEYDISYWTTALKGLKVGEFIAVGDFCVESGKPLRGTKILRTSKDSYAASDNTDSLGQNEKATTPGANSEKGR